MTHNVLSARHVWYATSPRSRSLAPVLSSTNVLPPEVEVRLRFADVATLDRWALRMLSATTLEEALA